MLIISGWIDRGGGIGGVPDSMTTMFGSLGIVAVRREEPTLAVQPF